MAAEAGIRALLGALAEGDPDEVLPLGGMLHGLGRRAFGMLLLVAALPAFIPIPGGGAIGGPLAVLVGLQLLAGRGEPWLPRVLARRGPHRGALARFARKAERPLGWLETVVRPRLPQVLHYRAAAMLSGLLLVAIGLLLSLPIPLTNYLFGGLLLVFALALLERDGALLLVGWIAGGASVTGALLLSGNLASRATAWVNALF
ncbi:MAG TPA: exopolysaccharide biosynthesis protein [Xanthomonadaceae bacterium]|nr:exopolysaccharide biosynthesis protein [Xanthomonadaceae bacterium]